MHRGVIMQAAARRQKEDDYGKILSMSYKFYEGQMSGELPPWNQHLYSKGGWRKSAHLKDNYNGIDLVGGFYDAGGELMIHQALLLRCWHFPTAATTAVACGWQQRSSTAC